jgi:hypothetical protein
MKRKVWPSIDAVVPPWPWVEGILPTITVARVIWFVFSLGDGVSLRCLLLSLAFRVAVLAVAVLVLAFAGFAFAFSSATFFVLSLSTVARVGVVADAERFPAAAGRIR